MSAGRYRSPVVLERPVHTVAPDGAAARIYVDIAPVFAAIRALSAREVVDHGRTESRVSHEIRLRFRSDVAAGWRVRAGLRTYRLLSVADPDERARELVCLADHEEGA